MESQRTTFSRYPHLFLLLHCNLFSCWNVRYWKEFLFLGKRSIDSFLIFLLFFFHNPLFCGCAHPSQPKHVSNNPNAQLVHSLPIDLDRRAVPTGYHPSKLSLFTSSLVTFFFPSALKLGLNSVLIVLCIPIYDDDHGARKS